MCIRDSFLRDLILGRAPGPDWPTVEELRVPILMTPGNHDYPATRITWCST